MTISPILRADQPDKNGLCKIYIRVSDGKKRSFIPTGIKVKPNQYKNGKVIGHKEADSLNKKLRQQLLSCEAKPKVKTTFQDFANNYIDHCTNAKSKSPATIKHYSMELQKFVGYAGDLSFNQITPDVMKGYKEFLAGKGSHHNTVWKSFKFLTTIFNLAIREKLIDSNPILKIGRMKYKQGERTYLTPEEVQAIAKLINGPLRKPAMWFLFQCNTGLRVSDLLSLDKKRVLAEGRITKHMVKTDELVSVPLTPEARKLLETMPEVDLSKDKYNEQLKSVALLAGINKNLSTHIARHTFGVRLAELGVSKEVARRLMGHTKESTTDIYYKIKDARVEEEFKGFKY